jgi:hypothetical protein
LDVLLRDGLLWDEGDMRLTRGHTDCLGVVAIILLSAYERLHVLWADDLHPMPERFKLARPVKGSRTCFDNHRTPVDLCQDLQKLIAHDPALENDAAIAVDAVELEYVLGDIDAEGLDRHCSSPSVAGSQPAVREGEPSIPLAGVRSTAA